MGQQTWSMEWPTVPARGPPEWEWDLDQLPLEEVVEAIPEDQFDQRISC